MTYYTKNGKKIWKPTAYAKTGAPMYKTKYKDSTNINAPTSIYKLNLENNKKYIGKTAKGSDKCRRKRRNRNIE